jgi:uncharacterized protein
MAENHPPTQARHIIADAKRGSKPLAALAREARTITDPSFAAEALIAIAQNPNLDGSDAARMIDEVLRFTGEVERTWRRAELLDHLARRAASWDPKKPVLREAHNKLRTGIAKLTLTLEGKELSEAIRQVANICPNAQSAELLHHVLTNGGDPANDAKEFLAGCSAPGLADVLQRWPDAALRARLLPYVRTSNVEGIEQALASAAILPPAQQVEVLRAVIASRDVFTDLLAVARRLPGDAEASARLLCALAARADKLGQSEQSAAWFEDAKVRVPAIANAKARESVLRNITTGMARLAGQAKPKPSTPSHQPITPTPAAPSARHILALVDTYEGRLSEVHLRAIGRAAPLCWAFGLDLGLIGFPTEDLAKLVRLAGTETNIGEGRGYLEKLAQGGRIHLVSCQEDQTPDWDQLGWAVATTPTPDARKSGDFPQCLEQATAAKAGRLCVLMGLGKKGLGPNMLKSAPSHLELTGKGVSLETATAMGILAERMRVLPMISARQA